MKIFIGNDHRGVALKRVIVNWLREHGHDVVNIGVDTSDSVDYPDQAKAVAECVVANEGSIGILMCGSGVGMQIAANKIVGIRAAQVWDEWIAEYARRHNNANVITFSNERQTHDEILALTDIFLNAEFEGGRHAVRIDKITALDERLYMEKTDEIQKSCCCQKAE
jgi:ribose 5-phosphate isomerase B